jgi:hypothetical protein
MATLFRPPLIVSQNPIRRIGLDVIPNLLMTTLAVVALIPPGRQLSASAPIRKTQTVACEQQTNCPLTLGINPQPQVQRWDWEAPPPEAPVVVVEQAPHPLTLGLNPQPQVQRWDWGAPAVKAAVEVDAFPNFAVRQIIVATPQVVTLSASAPITKWAVTAEQYQNILVLGFNPQPNRRYALPQLAAPSLRSGVQVDLAPNTLVLAPPVGLQQAIGTTPATRVGGGVDLPPNRLVLGLGPLNPQVWMWSDSAPVTRYAVAAEQYPANLVLQLVQIPNVVGETQAQATTDLQNAGFVVAVQTATSATVAVGLVISEQPTDAELPGTTVTITVSLGPKVAAEVPAGRIHRVLSVTIDGVKFECGSLEDALELLAQAKDRAQRLAEDQAMWAVAAQRSAAEPIPVPKLYAPKIEVSSRKLRAAASQTKREIAAIYESELKIAELRMLLEVADRRQEEEDILSLFL